MQMPAIIKNQLKLLFYNRMAVFAMIATPLLLTFLFTFSSKSGRTDLYIADSDHSSSSAQLINLLQVHEDINVVCISENELIKKVDNGSIMAGFIIQKKFEDNLKLNGNLNIEMVENYYTGESAMLEQAVLIEANTLQDVNNLNLPLESLSRQSTISVNVKDSGNGSGTTNIATVKLIGFLGMFLWFIVFQGFRSLVAEKSNHVFERIQGTQTSYVRYLLSKIIAAYVFALLLTTVVLIAGRYLFHTSQISNLPATAVLFAIYLFALTGIAMMFVPFVNKQQSFTILGSVIMALTGILGGSFFSIEEISSSGVKIISKFTPEYWAIQSICDTAMNNSSFNAQILPAAVLSFMGILGFIIACLTLTWKMKTKMV